jgi:hypothetical protein
MNKMNFLILVNLFIFTFSCSRPTSRTEDYIRKDWPHWSDLNKNCLNTRGEILQERSIVKIKFNKKGCKVVAGEWNDYYYPAKLNRVDLIDIDHLVPLKHAHEHGGLSWSKKMKEQFANDPENLVVTHRKFNRAKGPKGIDEWLPVKIEYACKYVQDWLKIKTKYNLNIGVRERSTISELKGKCASSAH